MWWILGGLSAVVTFGVWWTLGKSGAPPTDPTKICESCRELEVWWAGIPATKRWKHLVYYSGRKQECKKYNC